MTKSHLYQMIQTQESKINYYIKLLQCGKLQYCMTKKQASRMFKREYDYLNYLQNEYNALNRTSTKRVTFGVV